MFKKKDEEQVEEEILSMVEEGQKSGYIQEEEVEMISNILDLDDKIARDIMTSRNKIFAVSKVDIISDIISQCLESGYSRYPVYGEDIDNIVGLLHLKDMTRMYLENPEYVGCTMRNALQNKLDISSLNMFPIWRAFKEKLSRSGTENEN